MTLNTEIWLGVLSLFSAISVAYIGVYGKRLKGVQTDTQIVREEVKNSHTVNLRDEQDHRYETTSAALATINNKLDILDRRDLSRTKDMQQINGKVNDLQMSVHEHLRWSQGYTSGMDARMKNLEGEDNDS